MSEVLVIGGGAAGCMAAIAAAERGARVTLWEKNDRLGRKLAITGKGRCNVTNAAPVDELIRNISGNGRFMYSAFSAFDNADVMNFFEGLGVPLKVERGQRVFPQSDRAADVTSALEREMRRLGVKIGYKTSAKSLLVDGGRVVGAVSASGKRLAADAVILACGGATYQATGSTGDGYKLAAAVGHTIIEPLPALVPLVSPDAWVSEVSGLSLRNIELSLYKSGIVGKKQLLDKLFGEMLFTHFGISGPVVLSASRKAAIFWRDNPGEEILALINLKPALSAEQLAARLERDFADSPKRHLHNAMEDLLPKSLILPLIRLAGLEPDRPVNTLLHRERAALTEILQALPVHLTSTRPLNEGIVTCGGVSVKEVSPKTFESKLAQGLFIVGELLDVDALTGGYNLQVAFSSGHAAGLAAAEIQR
jgi:hypothetical protein